MISPVSPMRRHLLKLAALAAVGSVAAPSGRTDTLPAQSRRKMPAGCRARIATVCHGGNSKPTVAENRDYIMALLDQACAQRPDLVCLPETFPTAGPSSRLPRTQKSEPIPGPTIEAAARRAKQHRCYVVCPLATVRDGRHFNSAVILDRSGQIAGIYDKTCPVTSQADFSSLEDGCSPGPAELPVFDLDFGRVGIQICFDLGFPENWSALRQAGAQLVLWPSAYGGGLPLIACATLHQYYVVSSVRSGQSRIIDPCGSLVAESTKASPVVVHDLNLDFVVAHIDFNYGIADRIKAAYGDRVDVRMASPGSNHFIVEPVDPTLTCRQLQDEFGFESSLQYHDRHREAYRQVRAGGELPRQRARHDNRPQHRKA